MKTKILFKIRSQPKVRSNSRAIKATQFGKQRLLYRTSIALNLGIILEVERMNVWKKNSTALSCTRNQDLRSCSRVLVLHLCDLGGRWNLSFLTEVIAQIWLELKIQKSKCNHLNFCDSNVEKEYKWPLKWVFNILLNKPFQ